MKEYINHKLLLLIEKKEKGSLLDGEEGERTKIE